MNGIKSIVSLILGVAIGLTSFRTLDNWQIDRVVAEIRSAKPSPTETRKIDSRWTTESVFSKNETMVFFLPDRNLSEQMTDQGVRVSMGIRVEGDDHRERAEKLIEILMVHPELWRCEL